MDEGSKYLTVVVRLKREHFKIVLKLATLTHSVFTFVEYPFCKCRWLRHAKSSPHPLSTQPPHRVLASWLRCSAVWCLMHGARCVVRVICSYQLFFLYVLHTRNEPWCQPHGGVGSLARSWRGRNPALVALFGGAEYKLQLSWHRSPIGLVHRFVEPCRVLSRDLHLACRRDFSCIVVKWTPWDERREKDRILSDSASGGRWGVPRLLIYFTYSDHP